MRSGYNEEICLYNELSENLNETGFTGWDSSTKGTYRDRVTASDTSLTIGNTTYSGVIIVDKFFSYYTWPISRHCYAKNIGLVMSTGYTQYSNGDSLKLLAYEINQ